MPYVVMGELPLSDHAEFPSLLGEHLCANVPNQLTSSDGSTSDSRIWAGMRSFGRSTVETLEKLGQPVVSVDTKEKEHLVNSAMAVANGIPGDASSR